MRMRPALFSNVPAKDYMHLFDAGNVNGKKVAEYLKYKKEDISVAASVPVSSVRYDDKMPDVLRQRMTEWAIAINLIAGFFNDPEKTILWFNIPNPQLGDITPRDMIRLGRFNKLLKFIQSALKQNER